MRRRRRYGCRPPRWATTPTRALCRPLYESGRYAEAADRGRELIETHPGYPELLYNVACCESLAGRPAEAIEHLRLAIGRAEELRSVAAVDEDLTPIRDEPAFKELIRKAPKRP